MLIDGTGAPPLEDAAMLIGADGHIEWVGTSAAASVPEPARVVELGLTTLLPGLIDSHVHLSFDAGPDHAAVRAVLEYEDRQVRRVWRDGRVVVEDGRLAAPAVDDA